MKKIAALLRVLLSLFTACGAPAEESFKSGGTGNLITVDPEAETPETETPAPETEMADWTTSCMTFNVLKERNPGTEYADPDVRAPWILDTIVKYDPDLLGMQEVTKTSSTGWDMYTYLTTELAKKGYANSGLMDSKNKAGSKVAVADYTIASGLLIFWKRDRFELKDSGAQVYSNDAKRHFQWVKLYDKKEDITILMTNTHLSIPPKVGDTYDIQAGHNLRAAQGQTLFNYWMKNCGEDMALYATGDFNCKTDTQAFANMTQSRFVSTHDISQSSNANSSIDYIIINGEIQDCYKFHRCNETYEPDGMAKPDPNKRNQQYCPSDHYAVIAYCSNAYR